MVGSLIEKRLQSGILLSILHAADDLADVILKGCGRLPHMWRWLRRILIVLYLVHVIYICLQSLNELWIHVSTVLAVLDSLPLVLSWVSWAHASLLIRVLDTLKSWGDSWIDGHHFHLFAGISSAFMSLSPRLLYVEGCASKSKAMLNIEILAS